MKLKIIQIILLLLAINNIGCVQESVLSDVEINDPSLIRAEISLDRSKVGGTLTQSVVAWLYDKNNNAVELKNGAVLINGQEMLVKKVINAPYYSGIELISDIRTGNTYNFLIKLNSNKSYSALIPVQVKDLVSLDIPLQHNKNEDMNISWTDIDPDRPLKLEIAIYYKDKDQYSVDNLSFSIPPVNLTAGKYTIPAGYFQSRPNIYQASIALRSTVKGSIYEGFMPGSKIESTISISKNCSIF